MLLLIVILNFRIFLTLLLVLDEVNTEIVAKFQSRGFSASDKVKEKTQSIFENIETGVSDIKDFAESTANEFVLHPIHCEFSIKFNEFFHFRLLGREDDEQDIEYDFDDSLELDIDDADEKKKGGGNKIKKKKKKPLQGAITSHDDDDGTDDVELAADLLGGLGGGHGIKLPLKHGRSLGGVFGGYVLHRLALCFHICFFTHFLSFPRLCYMFDVSRVSVS